MSDDEKDKEAGYVELPLGDDDEELYLEDDCDCCNALEIDKIRDYVLENCPEEIQENDFVADTIIRIIEKYTTLKHLSQNFLSVQASKSTKEC